MTQSLLPAIATDSSVGSKHRLMSPVNILSQNALAVARGGTPPGETHTDMFSPMFSQLKAKGEGEPAVKGRNIFSQLT
jgi:hypothetical protein